MNLQQAQLGDTRGISLGGYIPAAAQKPRLLDQVLASIATSAVGAAAERGVQGLMTPDTGKQAIAADVDMAGLVRGADGKLVDERNWFQRNFAPNDQKAFQQALGQKQDSNYRHDVFDQTNEIARRAEEDRALGRTVGQAQYAESRQDGLAAQKFAQDQATATGARQDRAGMLAAWEAKQAADARTQGLALEKQKVQMSDPMYWGNIAPQAADLKLKGSQAARWDAETTKTNDEAKAIRDNSARMERPAQEQALNSYLEGAYPGNTQAQNLVRAGLGGKIPATPEEMKAQDTAIRESLSKNPQFAAYFQGAAVPALVVDDRAGYQRIGGLVSDLGPAAKTALDVPTRAVDWLTKAKPERDQAAILRDYMIAGIGFPGTHAAPPVMPTPEEIAARQAALKAQGY